MPKDRIKSKGARAETVKDLVENETQLKEENEQQRRSRR